MKKFVYLVIIFIFTNCSQKQYFEPDSVNWFGLEVNKYYMNDYISTINASGATTFKYRFIDKKGVSKNYLPKGFEFLNKIDNIILATNSLDSIYISNIGVIKVRGNVISASLKNQTLALVFANNSIAIYDLKNKKFKFKKYYEASVLNDTRIAMPIFLDTMILFPTLDGKVVALNQKNYSTKNIPVDINNDIKNIILLKTFGDTLVVATPNVIFSLSNGKVTKKDFFIQSYNYDGHYIYIATLDGQILKFTPSLELVSSKKFKFAKIQAIAVTTDNIYALESQGFVIQIDKNFTKTNIFKLTFENDEKTIAFNNTIYNGNRIFIFK